MEELNAEEIKELKEAENTTLKAVGILSELNKNNNKEFALKILDDLIKSSKNEHLCHGCYDALSFYSLVRFTFYLIGEKSPFFEPKFRLKKKELKNIELKILLSEID